MNLVMLREARLVLLQMLAAEEQAKLQILVNDNLVVSLLPASIALRVVLARVRTLRMPRRRIKASGARIRILRLAPEQRDADSAVSRFHQIRNRLL